MTKEYNIMNQTEYTRNQSEPIQLNAVYNCDCMERLWEIEDESIDLVILDPNYNDWDKMCADGLILQAVRVLKMTGNILCFTKQPFDFNLRNEINHIFRREIIWTFCNGGAWVSNKMPLVSFQKIYWCTVSKKFYFNPRTGLSYSGDTRDFKRSSKVFEGYNMEGRQFTKSEDGIWLRDHLHYNKPNSGKLPAKPQELIDILVRCFCPEGGVVLDPFSGSGSIVKAAIKQNKNYIAFELNKDYFTNIINSINTLF